MNRPEFVKEAAEKFGDQCIVVAIDAKKVSKDGEPDALGDLHPWRAQPDRHRCGDYARKVVALGAGEILLTSMDRDGTSRASTLRSRARSPTASSIPVVASGGVGNLDHLVAGIRDGHASAVLAASIFHFGEFTRSAGQGPHGQSRPADAARPLTIRMRCSR